MRALPLSLSLSHTISLTLSLSPLHTHTRTHTHTHTHNGHFPIFSQHVVNGIFCVMKTHMRSAVFSLGGGIQTILIHSWFLLSVTKHIKGRLFEAGYERLLQNPPNTAQWSLYAPPILTFSNSTFCPQNLFMYFVWI